MVWEGVGALGVCFVFSLHFLIFFNGLSFASFLLVGLLFSISDFRCVYGFISTYLLYFRCHFLCSVGLSVGGLHLDIQTISYILYFL